MLCRKFKLIPIKIEFFYEFLKLLKNRVKVPVLLYTVVGQKWLGEFSIGILKVYKIVNIVSYISSE